MLLSNRELLHVPHQEKVAESGLCVTSHHTGPWPSCTAAEWSWVQKAGHSGMEGSAHNLVCLEPPSSSSFIFPSPQRGLDKNWVHKSIHEGQSLGGLSLQSCQNRCLESAPPVRTCPRHPRACSCQSFCLVASASGVLESPNRLHDPSLALQQC